MTEALTLKGYEWSDRQGFTPAKQHRTIFGRINTKTVLILAPEPEERRK